MTKTPKKHIAFWFDFASTYSYPAAMRIEEVARHRGLEVSWKPFLLGPIFNTQGWNDSPFNIYPAKGRYMWRDMERLCHDLKLPFRRPSVFPRSGLLAARITCQFAQAPWLPDFVRSVYQANFEHDLEIASAATISACLASAGQIPEKIIRTAATSRAKADLRSNTEQAMQLGIFGAPSFVMNDELFWGNDRLEAAIAWAEHSSDWRSLTP